MMSKYDRINKWLDAAVPIIILMILVVVLVAICVSLAVSPPQSQPNLSFGTVSKLHAGMTYQQVIAVLGPPTTEATRSVDYRLVVSSTWSESGSFVMVMFMDGLATRIYAPHTRSPRE
jgi:hypothetical protein